MITFKDLPLTPEIIAILEKIGFTTPTDIQAKAIPLLLSDQKVDFWGQAQTGTGKTLAFGLPLIQKINPKERKVQALVVAPTRELAVQITQSLRQVSQPLGISIETIYGGASMPEQINALRRGVNIVVGTPGRINDHIKRRTLSLSEVKTLVLDEADIMLDMGFKEEVDEIIKETPADRQIWLFSATIKPGIKNIMSEHMRNTKSVRVGSGEQTASSTTKQHYAIVPSKSRFAALCRFIDKSPNFYGFIFCQTKALTAEVAQKLSESGYPARALHGDMSQVMRNMMIKQFKNKEFTILVATDVAARGIDISDLTHVINYTLPTDQESYIHRIGRTGRAGKEGIAITLLGSNAEARRIKSLESKFKTEITPIAIPTAADIAGAQISKAQDYVQSLIKQSLSEASGIFQLKTAIASLSQDQLVHALTILVAQKFFGKSSTGPDIQASSYDNSQGGDSQELMLNVGSDDGITTEDLAEFLQKEAGVQASTVEKLKMLKRRSFLKLTGDNAQDVIDKLRGKTLGGRKLTVNFAPADDEQSFRPRGGGFRGGGKSSRFGGKSGGESSRGGSRGGGFRRGSSSPRRDY